MLPLVLAVLVVLAGIASWSTVSPRPSATGRAGAGGERPLVEPRGRGPPRPLPGCHRPRGADLDPAGRPTPDGDVCIPLTPPFDLDPPSGKADPLPNHASRGFVAP